MVRIKEYRISQSGDRGLKITLPGVWVKDVGARKGDRIDVYRDEEDRLILVLAKGRKGGRG
jgi:bifunctional DNA-binding transcriptional regulator/antitoxin component of YhaV-PrlF toxin-antitoxin module